MSSGFTAYFEHLDRLCSLLEELTGIAKEKTAAVMQGNLTAVDQCIRKEQALSLTLRSLDKKREEMLADLGLAGVPLSGLAAGCPAEHRIEARQMTERLQNSYKIYRSAADVARTTLECSLHQIEKHLDQDAIDLPSDRNAADIRA